MRDESDQWCTISHGAAAHRKSPETIRRWLREDDRIIRTRWIMGVKYVHVGDLADAAARRPAGTFAEQAACGTAGHQPTPVAGLDAGGWISLGHASRAVKRSKTTMMRWADSGDVRSTRCTCTRRRYIWADDLENVADRHR